MPIVSRCERDDYLKRNLPNLHKLCAYELPRILACRFSTEMSFCYGASGLGAAVPAHWDSEEVRVLPLWEGGSSFTALRIAATGMDFVQIAYEDPSDIENVAQSTRGLFTHLFFFLIEPLPEGYSERFREIEELAIYLEFDGLGSTIDLVRRLSGRRDNEDVLAVTRAV